MLYLITFNMGQTDPVSLQSTSHRANSLYTEYVQYIHRLLTVLVAIKPTHVLPTCVPVSHKPDSNVPFPLHCQVYSAPPQKVNPLLLTLCDKLPTHLSVVRHWLSVFLQIIITYPHGCLHSWAMSYVFCTLASCLLGLS